MKHFEIKIVFFLKMPTVVTRRFFAKNGNFFEKNKSNLP